MGGNSPSFSKKIAQSEKLFKMAKVQLKKVHNPPPSPFKIFRYSTEV